VEVFGKPAQVVRDYLTKGRQVYVEGSIRYDEWTDKEGKKRNTTKIHIGGPNSRLVLLGGPGGARGETSPRGAAGAAEGERMAEGAPSGDDFKASDDDVPF
jgi:single-strand DNA-binding protein